MNESNIKYERGSFWVLKTKAAYHVMRAGLTHSKTESAYALDDNGLSIAKARCDYLANRYDESKATK